MEKTLKRTASSTQKFRKFGEDILPPIRHERHTKMNVQRREKLGKTLTDNFTSKYGQKNKGIIQKEIKEFLKRERLNENDLKQFELSIQNKLKTKKNKELLKERNDINVVGNNKYEMYNKQYLYRQKYDKKKQYLTEKYYEEKYKSPECCPMTNNIFNHKN